ncbi:helix-turn-helix domain-containing protein [Burkholderia gladioli]|nr:MULTISPECIES: helix-turn-helix domain-containing protein [Burkholderia]NIE87113.1 helix-turn-helix domain-containing protein [Burkholderia sp. Tr-860]NIF65666.1 helix-turn-helix domain-containing protein [Burkholderia sp. Cy-647]NIG00188.1 helix-turn-helix domain-containing protein [Burkholderia sp. Ax-1720]
MRHKIEQASDIGGVIRAARKAQQLRQDDAAGSMGVSLGFMVKAEAGETSVQWGKLFQILEGLGVQVILDIPDASEALLRNESRMARHRAAAREFRSVERLHEPEDTLVDPDRHIVGSKVVLRAAERLLATTPDKRSRSGATVKRASKLVKDAATVVQGEPSKGKARK